ncbi:MAG: PH domain-containing protein [Alphaproteobacteria bacterium]|nr:PH domain-containing protein [Alphaproteobacteria bacterium]
MSSYVKKMLLPDERLLYLATLHWVIFLPGLVLSVIAGLAGFFSYHIAGFIASDAMAPTLGKALAGASMFFSIIGFGLLIAAMVRQSATELAITNRRLIAKYGFVARNTFEIMVNRVTGANFDQTVMGRILGYGTIIVHGAGGDTSPFDLVANPHHFHHALMRVLEDTNKHHGSGGSPLFP